MYRHILKKHLRQKHGINAQRLDDRLVFFFIFYIYYCLCAVIFRNELFLITSLTSKTNNQNEQHSSTLVIFCSLYKEY